jgi:excinuclease ABC subunit C
MQQQSVLSQLRARIAKAPDGPGVYRFLDAEGTVLYVGKAKSLKNRLKSYVNPGAEKGLGPWKIALIAQISDFDVTVAGSELEALVLETNLIKQLKPKYNVLMKDDKNYVYVRVSVQEPYPRIEVVRQMADDGAKYFGPKTSAEKVRGTLSFLRKIFPYRTCKMEIEVRDAGESGEAGEAGEGYAERPNSQVAKDFQSPDSPDSPVSPDSSSIEEIPGIPLDLPVICTFKDRPTPCLDFHIGHCSAPCIGRITPERYRSEIIEPILQFLKGDHADVARMLKERMNKAAADKKFELAARLRDQVQSIERIQERQAVSDTSGEDTDYVGVAVLSNRAHVVVLQERGGKVINESSFSLKGHVDDASQVLDEFLPQYYGDVPDLPDVVAVGEVIEEAEVLAEWLSGRKGKKVVLRVPERGKKSKLMEMAEKNAAEKARQMEVKWEAEKRNTEDALAELSRLLGLKGPPSRIEGYDISHLGGTETVGSMVVVKNGKPANDQYRSFTIQSVKAGDVDDYKSLQEVLRRRLRHLSGGFAKEEERWAERGIVVGKAKKEDQAAIETIMERHPDDLSPQDVDYRAFVVARHEGNIVGMGRLRECESLLELASLWVDEEHRGAGLRRFIARFLLRRAKKGKVYARIKQELEEYYAQIGFRHVIKPPKPFHEWLERMADMPDAAPRMVMMYDAVKNKTDVSLSAAPDLLVIDGGKGQLSAVCDVLREARVEIPVIGLAKREEEVFTPGSSFPVTFPPDSPARFLLMRLRDESHRFANRHREKRKAATMTRSALDDIPGVGPETKKKLLRRLLT